MPDDVSSTQPVHHDHHCHHASGPPNPPYPPFPPFPPYPPFPQYPPYVIVIPAAAPAAAQPAPAPPAPQPQPTATPPSGGGGTQQPPKDPLGGLVDLLGPLLGGLLMVQLDEAQVKQVQRGLATLAAASPQHAGRLMELQRTVAARGARRDPAGKLTDAQLDQVELLVKRLQQAVQAHRDELTVQMKQVEEHEQTLGTLAGKVQQARKKSTSSRSR